MNCSASLISTSVVVRAQRAKVLKVWQVQHVSSDAFVMVAFVSSAFAKSKVMPFVGSFVTTTVSGLIFAAIAIPAKHAGFDLFLVMVPVILGTALFNAIVVQALAAPLTQVTNHQ